MSYIFRILVCALILLKPLSSVFAGNEESMIQSVLKINTYEYSKNMDTYIPYKYGSAIYIGSGRILTNAHVVFGSDEKTPTGLYEVCYSQKSSKPPVCSSDAKLIQYDKVNDLALLEIPNIKSNKGINPINSSVAEIGSSVIIYGYPGIGGESITRTSGRIAGSEKGSLKVDAIIDRGNSGGGAFDEKGNLIGIPYAIVSNNATIGYIIPVSKVTDFLSSKTKAIKYAGNPDKIFYSYLSKIHSYLKNPKKIKDNIINIQGAEKYGLTLSSINRSKDDSLVRYNYKDKDGNIDITVACTKDTGFEEYWSMIKNTLPQIQKYETDRNITSETRGKESEYYIIYSDPKEVPKEKGQYYSTVYYKKYDACYGSISSNSRNEDKVAIEKGLNFLTKGVTFNSKYTISTAYKSTFFNISKVPEEVHITDSILPSNEKSASLLFKLKINRWVGGDLFYLQFKSKSEYFSNFFEKGDSNISSYSLGAFFNKFQTSQNIDSAVMLYSSNNKPYIFTRYYDVKKQEENLRFVYPFVNGDGFYYALVWEANFKLEPDTDFEYIYNFFRTIELPGNEALAN